MSRKISILIVAKPYDALLLRRYVEGAGMAAIIHDGDLKSALPPIPPTLAIVAHSLPAGPGAEFARRLRLAWGEAVRLLVLVRPTEPIRSVLDAETWGADGLLRAPVAEAELLARIEEACTVQPMAQAHPAIPPNDLAQRAPTARTVHLGTSGAGGADHPTRASRKQRAAGARSTGEATGVHLAVAGEESDRPATSAVHRGAGAPPSTAGVVVDRDAPGAKAPVAEGRFASMPIGSLLATLFRHSYTGALRCCRGEDEKAIYFDEGYPVFARSNLPDDRLLSFARRLGLISPEQASRCEQAHEGTGRRVAGLLLEQGAIGDDELAPLVRRHVLSIIYSLFGWTEGRYFFDSEVRLDERIGIELHPSAIILEGIRRKVGADELIARVGAPSLVLAADEVGLASLAYAELEAAELEALDLIRQGHSLAQVVARSSLDEAGVYRVAYGLQVLSSTQLVPRIVDAGVVAPAQSRGPTMTRQRVAGKLALMHEGSYFALLGLSPDASAREVSQAHSSLKQSLSAAQMPAELVAEFGGALRELGEVLDEARDLLVDPVSCEAYRRVM